jgi:hypothetical protein
MGINVWRHLYFQWLGRNKNDTPHNLDVSSSMICESQEGKLISGDLKAPELSEPKLFRTARQEHHSFCNSACVEILGLGAISATVRTITIENAGFEFTLVQWLVLGNEVPDHRIIGSSSATG